LIADQSGVVPGAVEQSSGRIADLQPSLAEWSERPLLGQGFATRVPTGPSANARLLDNQWLLALLETGVVGVAAWFWLLFRSVRRLGRIAKHDRGEDGWLAATLAASLAVYGATMLTYDAFGFVQVTFVFFIVAGLSARVVDMLGDRSRPADASRSASSG
jgi:O-antigen ligase